MYSSYNSETKVWHATFIPYGLSQDVMLGEIVHENLKKKPDRVLQISSGDDSVLSAEDLLISSIRIAQNLKKIGVNRDDVVSIISHQSHLATQVIHGCIVLGAIINPLDGSFSVEDIRGIYQQTKPKLIICDQENIPKLRKALSNVQFTYKIYTTSRRPSLFIRACTLLTQTDEENNFTHLKFSQPSDEKILAIICSSGTSGSPKGVCISHAQCIQWCTLLSDSSRTTKSFSYSPIYWVTGFMQNLLLPFTYKDTRIILNARDDNFTIDHFIAMIEKYQLTSLTLPPTQLARLLNSEKFITSKIDCVQSFSIPGSISSEFLRKKFERMFPNKMLMVPYGMTEVSISITAPGEFKLNLAVGSMLYPNVQVKIVNESGVALNNGQQGEIYAKPFFKFLVSNH
jgi:acyl-coenzyme A synthetase/AMP-(fatty) acid ligase